MALSPTEIQNAYVAFFNRPADVAGLTYWGSYAGSAGDLLNTFAKSAEYNALYSGLNNTQLVNAIYQNLFGRSPDVDGLNYWVNQLDSGKVTIGNAANTIQTGAQGTDKSIIDNKVAAATAFTTALDTTAEIVGYAGASSATLGQVKAWLSTVTDTSTSLEAAKTGLTALTGSLAGGTNEAATTYVLTSNQDILTGTNNNDSFRAVAGNAISAQDQTTLNSSDIIDGGAGTDALIVNMTGAAYNGGARIKNVETLQIGTNQAAATFEYNVNAGSNEVTGVKTIVADQINTGEALTINNLVRDDATTAIPTVSWVNDNTGANGLAGTVNVNYRAATVAGTADEQALSLTNVRAGTLNLATGVEKATLTSAGTATNSIDKVQSGTTLTDVVIKADAQLGGARVVSDVTATKGLEINRTPINANTEHTSFVNMGASVKNVTAEGSKAGVNIAFTDTGVSTDFAYKDNTFVGGDGADSVIVNGGNDKLTGGKGADSFIFRQTNTSANGSFFNNSDTIDGGEGSDAIMIDYARDSAGTQTQVVIQTSEWLNSKGLDVLDLRATNTRVQLDDAFVGGNDVGSFEVVTNKIVQSDSTTSVADEANSFHQIDLTTVGASRAVKVTGGEGRESVIVTDALNGVQTIAGGNGLDVLVVQNGATLTGEDLSNVSGMNVFNLVKTSGNAQSYQIDLTADFLTKAVDANASAGTSKNTANAFRILTDTADGKGAAISGVQQLAAGDTINITVDTTGLTTAGAINIDDLIASGATVIVKNTSGTTLYSNQTGSVVAGTGIFAGAASTANTAYTNLTTNPVAGVGTPVASGQASSGGSSGGSSGSAGNTFTLTAANGVLSTTANVNATPAATFLTANGDVINATSTTLSGATILDATTGDNDTMNLVLTAALAVAPTIQRIENINIDSYAAGALSFANVLNNTSTTVTGTAFTATNVAAAQTITLSGVSGAQSYTTAAATATDAITFNLAGTVTGAALTTADSGPGAIETVNLNVTSASTLALTTLTAASTVNVTGAGVLTLNDNDVSGGGAGSTITANASTGSLVYSQLANSAKTLTGSAQADSFTFNTVGTLTNGDVINGGNGVDTINTSGWTATTNLDGVTNVENLNLTGASVAYDYNTVDALVAFGQTFTVSAASATGTSTLRFNGAAETNGVFNVTGGANNDTLIGGANSDTINGGAGNDTITGGAGADVVSGGAGTNTFVFAAGANGAAPSATVFDIITDFRTGTNNVIDFGATAITIGDQGTAAAAGVATISGTGVATFNAADTTLAQHLTAVAAAIVTAGATVAGESVIWQEGANAYLFISDNVNGVSANDVLIQLTGVTVAAGGLTIGGGDITAIA